MGKDATERRGETLDAEHPLQQHGPEVAPELGDCIADVPPEVLEEIHAFHGNEEPPDTPIPEEELV